MPTFIAGLPLHPLVVHAVVVLVPLAVLTGVVIAVWPAARRRYGWPVAALAVLATVSVPLATSSGEALEHRLPADPLVEAHARLGDQLLVFVASMAVALVALVLLDRYRTRAEGPGAAAAPVAGWGRPAAVALAVVAVVVAVVSVVQVVRIGDAGARAVWHDTQYVAPHGGDDD